LTEEDLQKISKLLEMGGTMLAQHCERCGAPIFRYQGEEICPLCETSTQTTPTQKEEAKPAKTTEGTETIEDAIKNKIEQIAREMKREKDPSTVKIQLECIKLGMEILDSKTR